MKLRILTWNINFIHDNWLKRLDNINKTLQIEIENSDIILANRLSNELKQFENKIYSRDLFNEN